MNASTLRSKQVRLAVSLFAMLTAASSTARAGDWLPPTPLCPSAVLSYIPLWSIPTSTGILCFVGEPPTAPSDTIFDVAVVPVIVKLLDANKNVVAVNDPTQPLYVPVNSIQGFTALNAVDNSPIFASRDFTLGSTSIGTAQWGEATERASFWKYPGMAFKNWHVQMATFPITPSVTLEVPYGSWEKTSQANTYGVDQTILDPFLLKVAKSYSKGMPILLTYNIGEYSSKGCCAFGYHHTYVESDDYRSFFIWGSYLDAPGFGVPDLGALSHEVAEFMHDPLGNNPVQPWPAPFTFKLPWDPPYTFTKCQGNLEVGDPIEDRSGAALQYVINTPVMTYHFQNVITASWAMQAEPSFSVNGWYTLKGAIDGEFASPAPACPTL